MSGVTDVGDRGYSPGRLHEAARAHPLRAFFFIAFAITWVYETVVYGLIDLEAIQWSIPATFGPAIAAVIVTRAVEGKAGVRSFLRAWSSGASMPVGICSRSWSCRRLWRRDMSSCRTPSRTSTTGPS